MEVGINRQKAADTFFHKKDQADAKGICLIFF